MGCPKSVASPSLAGKSPVSIFMVVDLPQPLDPRKPKISPRSIDILTSFTAVKLPNRRVRRVAVIAGSPPISGRGGIVSFCRSPRFSGGQKGDEGLLQIARPRAFH